MYHADMRITLGVILTMLLQFGCAHDPAVVRQNRPVGRQEVRDGPRVVKPPVVTATPSPTPEPYTVLEELPRISRVHPLGDGRVELCVPWKNTGEGWELATKDKSGAALTVWPLQAVFIRNVDRLGAGAYWIEYLGDRDGYLVFREHTWFYDIVPESNRRLGVRPYGNVAD
ncbi:MAG: hypothetical protein JWN40_2332 [Phycisphaerales bacterium]|nr:hypothetical protein [Phycisphaerales bacterium]